VLADIHDTATEALSNVSIVAEMCTPRLNIAIPSPASDRIEIDRAMIAGISIPHLNASQLTRPDGDYLAEMQE
jgi:hypothetical protein